ncbi:tetratricopeptide repeat protein [Undibacterium sp. CY18W]|uniref:Tetratricopeptide repeat protein n=1 Tax=Undibacterium hunanense TaxID=2762292 RepID=A0ABR6ZWQ0_9BURK|nr:tetratricopeptide repeat protein [Undibacterium hunanense]MBC3920307.1 tetratricopeptide repeat protein [Undibacterium hunanense]
MKATTSLFLSPSRLASMLGAALLVWSAAALAQDPNAEGRRFLAEGNTSDASKKFAEAAKVNPFDASALNNQAVALAAQGDSEKALNLLERANRLSPNRADIAANLNELRNWMNRNSPQIAAVQRKAPVPGAYPIQGGDIPPEPPPLWKK